MYVQNRNTNKQKTNLWLPKWRGRGGETNKEYGINIYKLLCIK